MINEETFLELWKLGKSLKRPIICITNDSIIGTDRRFASLSIIYLDKVKYDYVLEFPICFDKKEIYAKDDLEKAYSSLMKGGMKENVDENENEEEEEDESTKKKSLDLFTINFIVSNYLQIGNFYIGNDMKITKRIFEMMSRTLACKSNQLLYQEPDMKSNARFMEINNSKASLGGKLHVVGDRYVITTSPTLHPINKPDAVSMNIYYADDISYIAEFIITKKAYTIFEYFRYRYVM